MPWLELSAITGPLAKMGVDKAFTSLSRSEAVIKARRRLGLPAEPQAGDFEAIYRHALVDWGMFKPEAVLDFFRDERIYQAFRRAWHENNPQILQTEAGEVVRWAEEFGAFRGLEYDPRREIAAFTAAFDLIVDYTRTAAEARHDGDMSRLEGKMDEMLAMVRQRTPAGAGPAAIGGDVIFSGQFHNVIINLLSQLSHTTQGAGGFGGPTPPPLPPLDEDGRPPLPDPGSLPPRSRPVYGRNPLFTGREDELRDLARRLLYDPAGTPAVISTGIGGIGKTQLAVEFAYRFGRFFAGGVQWVSLADGDPAVVGAEVADCGALMGLWSPGEDVALGLAEKVARTAQAWRGAEPRLLIFDNCEEPALLARWRPAGGGARVLVTSRSDDWPAGFAALAVPTLPRAQSVALLREYLTPAGRAEPPAALDEVAAELGDLPLALTLAGSYLADSPSIRVARYLDDLRRVGPLDHLRPRDGATAYSWTTHDLDVARTFQISLEGLAPATRPPDAAARLVLAGATCLVPGEPFPWALAAGMVEAGDDAPLPDAAVRRLLALGLLERAGGGRLRLHRLVAAFAARALAGDLDAARAAVEGAVISLARQQDVRRDTRPIREWMIHFRHVTDSAMEREDERAADLCGALDYCLSNSGDLGGALPYSRRALAVRERVLGPEHPDTASSCNNLGVLCYYEGNLPGAAGYMRRALAIWEKSLGAQHSLTQQARDNLAAIEAAIRAS